MPQYLTKAGEEQIRKMLDCLAGKFKLSSSRKESYFRNMGYYLDRLWYIMIESEEIPLVAFEIEKGIPSNERIRKDIFNIALSRAPKGYLITAHKKILASAQHNGGTWETWYRDHFFEAFDNYRKPFVSWCDIQVVDADMFLSSGSLRKSVVYP